MAICPMELADEVEEAALGPYHLDSRISLERHRPLRRFLLVADLFDQLESSPASARELARRGQPGHARPYQNRSVLAKQRLQCVAA